MMNIIEKKIYVDGVTDQHLEKFKEKERRWGEMERKRVICLFLFASLILVFSSCHPRHVSDIRPNMTKEEVVSSWGRTDLISHRTVDGRTIETWEYHFLNSGSVCWVAFSKDRVVSTECRNAPRGGYYAYPYYPYYYPYPYPYYYPYYYRYHRYWW
jgi:hypothetical protein